MNQGSFIIAVDGYSSCGKSTVARKLASQLNFLFIDSGALYRAITWYIINHKIRLEDHDELESVLGQISVSQYAIDGGTKTFLNDIDVSLFIRQMDVSNSVSQISAQRAVRAFVVGILQKIGSTQNIIMDGRDIGTVVFPHAHLKVFMDARPEVRARRRYAELIAKGEQVSLSEIMDNLLMRDQQDSTRAESPLRKANDAFYLDTSDLTEEEVLHTIMQQYTYISNRDRGEIEQAL